MPTPISPAMRMPAAAEPYPLKKPRHWVWDFLLHVASCGLYSPFWLVGRIRDLKHSTGTRASPWLWFPAMIFAPLQVLALPWLVYRVTQVEKSLGYRGWGAWGYAWALATTVLTAGFGLLGEYDLVFLAQFYLLLCMRAGLLCLFEARINRLKQAVGYTTYKPRNSVYTPVELVVLIVGALALAANTLLTADGPLGRAKFAENHLYTDPDRGFVLTLPGTGWRTMPFSNRLDTALSLERHAPDTLYAHVFVHGYQAVEDVATFRLDQLNDARPGRTCYERRQLDAGRNAVRATLTCENRLLGTRNLDISTLIETDTGTYELLIQLTSKGEVSADARAVLTTMADSFGVQP